MTAPTKTLIAAMLASTLVLAGCIDSLTGTDDGLTASAAGEGTVVVRLNADNVPDDLAHLELVLSKVFVHDAATPMPEGYVELSTEGAGGGTIVHAGDATSLKAGEGPVPAGDYDQVLLRFTKAAVMRGEDAAMASDGHDHGDAGDGHDHGTGAATEVGDPNGIDIPIHLAFEVVEDQTTTVELFFDAGATTEGGSFKAAIARATVTRNGNLVDELTDVEVTTAGTPATTTSTAKPVARIAVFAPDGAQVFKADFLAEDDEFANAPSSPFQLGANITFSGTDSEAVEASATVESFAWDFDDGTTGNGATITHAFDAPGVFEVTLTVTDSLGGEDTHTVRVVTSGWSTTTYSTSFEEADEAWTVVNGDIAGVAGATGLSGWARDGAGRASEVSWHVGLHLHDITESYVPLADSTLISPEIEIPSTWSGAGFEAFISGASEAGFDELVVSYTIDGGEPVVVGAFAGSMGWTKVGTQDALNDAIGAAVQFTFAFTSDELTQNGGGWFVDDLTIGGVDVPLHKAELLEEASHDGHDHEH